MFLIEYEIVYVEYPIMLLHVAAQWNNDLRGLLVFWYLSILTFPNNIIYP